MSKSEQDIQTGCRQIHFTGNEQQPTSRDLMIQRGGKFYVISIATPQFVEGLNTYNRQHQLEPSAELGGEFYLMYPIPSVDELCKKLSQIPFAQLQPYLSEQKSE